MPVNMAIWRENVRSIIEDISEEAKQRRAWFGIGSEIWSAGDAFINFFDDFAVDEFIERPDCGWNDEQIRVGRRLSQLMRKLSDETPEFIEPDELIDDPRWIEIRGVASQLLRLLSRGSAQEEGGGEQA